MTAHQQNRYGEHEVTRNRPRAFPQHQTGRTCMGRYENDIQRTGDTVASRAC